MNGTQPECECEASDLNQSRVSVGDAVFLFDIYHVRSNDYNQRQARYLLKRSLPSKVVFFNKIIHKHLLKQRIRLFLSNLSDI